jgi:hypothetical protein
MPDFYSNTIKFSDLLQELGARLIRLNLKKRNL